MFLKGIGDYKSKDTTGHFRCSLLELLSPPSLVARPTRPMYGIKSHNGDLHHNYQKAHSRSTYHPTMRFAKAAIIGKLIYKLSMFCPLKTSIDNLTSTNNNITSDLKKELHTTGEVHAS